MTERSAARAVALTIALGAAPVAAAADAATIDSIPLVGPARLTKLERDLLDAVVSIDPSLASNAGLFDDAARVPHYDPASVQALAARIDRDLAKMARLPWRTWDVHTQVDFRWMYAVGETARRALLVERVYEHRPGQWLEPVANNLLSLQTYAPDRTDLQDRVLDLVPAMLDEARAVCTSPTKRDLVVAKGLVEALTVVAQGRGHTASVEALARYGADLAALAPTRDYQVIGAENYAWRLKHAMLLPWTPEELLALAESELARVDGLLAAHPLKPPRAPTAEEQARADALDREGQLALYDGVSAELRAATLAGGWVSIPEGVGPIRARETPPAIIPLSGDGGSMNPPPTFVDSDVSFWNVEHFDPALSNEDRVRKVVGVADWRVNGMGTYAAHEGVPGHHLQLAVARLNPDPLRSIVPDCAQNEGWGLYAEQALAEHGGFGEVAELPPNVLRSYRGRIRRVHVDVNVETERWTLDQAGEWKYAPEPGEVDGDMLRAINWPTQLVCYFAGKQQILALREAARAKAGAAWDERAFHDALLQAGSIPLALVRAEMLGEPVPGIDE